MKIILLSGGSGKRLWPLTNDSRSKQFLKILQDSDGESVSMVQRVWRQLERVGLAESTFIATGSSQVDMLRNQLGDIPMIVEPDRRDTFPAIALAAAYLYSQSGIAIDETIAICAVDPYVEDRFFNHIMGLEASLLHDEQVELSLIGVRPTYPSSKYGYIIPGERYKQSDHLYHVNRFQEKPTEAVAATLIEQQALWNCGVFAFRLNYMLDWLKAHQFPVDFHELRSQYHLLPKTSFDYEIVEKAQHVLVSPYEGFWKDLGTWSTITDEMASAVLGKGKISPDSTNVHIINEMDIPVIVLGMHNTVIASSPDGILVTEKAASPRIKEMLGEFDQRPMYEERRWGWYRILDFVKHNEGLEVLTKKIVLHEGKNLSYHSHHKRTEIWTITKGDGLFILNGKLESVKSGDVLRIPPNALHAILANNDLEFIEVQSGSELVESDVYRDSMEWEEIINNLE
jgi:mannose-1-phosphate guanylyltransferase